MLPKPNELASGPFPKLTKHALTLNQSNQHEIYFRVFSRGVSLRAFGRKWGELS